jgi:hypothetical protein
VRVGDWLRRKPGKKSWLSSMNTIVSETCIDAALPGWLNRSSFVAPIA